MDRFAAIVFAGLLLASGCTGDGAPGSTASPSATAPLAEPGPDEGGAAATVRRPGRIVDALPNVENSVFALGSVWAVTSNQPDEFSPGPIEAAVVRIDPSTGRVERILAAPGLEPTFAVGDDRLWVKLADRLAVLDADGREVESIPHRFGRSDDLAEGGDLIWVVTNEERRVAAVDPDTLGTIRTVELGRFPVQPVSAFGSVWIPDLIDGTLTIVDQRLGSDTPVISAFVTRRPKNVIAVPGGPTGDEVWVTNIDGEVYAVSAGREDLGAVRQIAVDRPINRAVVAGDRVILLPTWGRSVLVVDLTGEEVMAEIAIDSIPVRAVVAHDHVWITGDGDNEVLTVLDPATLTVRARFEAGANVSSTTGPQQPIVVGREVWVPNRGDGAFLIVSVDELGVGP